MDTNELESTLQLTRYAISGTYTLFVYDFVILLDSESTLIYKSRWTLTKSLYLCCRFFPIIAGASIIYSSLVDHDIQNCKALLIMTSIFYILTPILPQCIYVLRAWAFTGAERWSLLIYLPALISYLFFISWEALYNLTFSKDAFRILGKSGCINDVSPQNKINDLRRMLVAGIILDSIVGLHVAIHCFRLWKPQTRLAKLLLAQGILYFPLMFILYTGALAISSIEHLRGYDTFAFSAVFVVSNLLACRFILEIKEYLNDPVKREIFSELQFGQVGPAAPVGTLSTGAPVESIKLTNRMKDV